jgi:hypothetical protein
MWSVIAGYKASCLVDCWYKEILDTRLFVVGISRNSLKIRGVLSWVTFPTSRSFSLCYMLDGGGEPEHTGTCSVPALYHHVQQLYSTTLSHTANCCGRYKPIWTVSCISHNISPLSRSICQPSSHCKAVSLITIQLQCSTADNQTTTQHKAVAVHQPITQYQTLCCYLVSRQSLLDVQWLWERVKGDREMGQLCRI